MFAQGNFSGGFQLNGNYFQRDTGIGAAGIPQYDNFKTGGESWMNLNYSNWGFDFRVRFDLFGNSNLHNPTAAYTDVGLGMFSIGKKVGNLGIQAGYIYDQIGSGILFRAYEERSQALDNALLGVHLTYW